MKFLSPLVLTLSFSVISTAAIATPGSSNGGITARQTFCGYVTQLIKPEQNTGARAGFIQANFYGNADDLAGPAYSGNGFAFLDTADSSSDIFKEVLEKAIVSQVKICVISDGNIITGVQRSLNQNK